MADRLTWKQIQEKYPDQWVTLEDVKYLDNDGCNNVDINGVTVKGMFDTGADIPVFCKGKDLSLEFTKSMDGVSEL